MKANLLYYPKIKVIIYPKIMVTKNKTNKKQIEKEKMKRNKTSGVR